MYIIIVPWGNYYTVQVMGVICLRVTIIFVYTFLVYYTCTVGKYNCIQFHSRLFKALDTKRTNQSHMKEIYFSQR